MKTNHTPAPWEYKEDILSGNIDIVSAKREFITLIYTDSDTELAKIDIANAKLIAAAPELLEALIEVVRISDRKHDAWDKAKAAIKKATE
jgi:hypothetical protein